MPNLYLDQQCLDLCAERYPGYPKLAASVLRSAKVLSKRVTDHANATLAPFGLTHPEFNVMMMLFGTPDYTLNPSLLSDAAGEKSANMTRLTDHLCAKGLVERTTDSQDRRKIAVTLTLKGREMLQQVLPAISVSVETLTQGLTPRELTQLAQLQRKFLDHMEE